VELSENIAQLSCQGKHRPGNGDDMGKKSYPKPPPGHKVIFRPWRRCPKTGDVLFAKAFGLKAWPIIVPE